MLAQKREPHFLVALVHIRDEPCRRRVAFHAVAAEFTLVNVCVARAARL